jgi:CheY-like chemotaxis protein
LLAGRKLLLADDSITIQKVVDLTFADEGVSVVCVNNGREAIERLAEFIPDVVLADVFMPQMNGYELCEYIKQNEKLKHIPVMLLVGSFEPFDEEEARRVGANDTLTKPFQSIRRLMEKVGMLTSDRPPEEQIPTAELPKPEVTRDVTSEPEAETLTEEEIAITTADTQPLPPELGHIVEQAASLSANKEREQVTSHAKVNDGMMESKVTETRTNSPGYEAATEVLLDLGDFAGRSNLDDDFALELDLDEIPEPSPVEAAFPASTFRRRDRYGSSAKIGSRSGGASWSSANATSETSTATVDRLATTLEFQQNLAEPVNQSASQMTSAGSKVVEAGARERKTGQDSPEQCSPAASLSAEVSLQQLSPEMIDAIARRAVEHLSNKVVEEIAWEVVPQLAELLIRKQLEEKSS